MSSLQSLKKRLTGVKNINQMTSAMELVAATKMRRAQEIALASRPYAITALEILANVSEALAGEEYRKLLSRVPLLAPSRVEGLAARKVKKTAILLIAADKGLAGSFNSAVFRQFEKWHDKQLEQAQRSNNSNISNIEHVYVAVGQKAHDYLKRRNVVIEASFTRYGDAIHLQEILSLTELLMKGFTAGRFDRVLVFSTNFRSALKQDVVLREVLPIEVSKIRQTVEDIIPESGRYAELKRGVIESRPARAMEYLIEPTAEATLTNLLPLLFKMHIYNIILEANASEHSARRMAMKNASDNASELSGELSLEYNRTRQAAITKEIIEITSTASAMR